MLYCGISIYPVIAGVVIYMALGMLWYSPLMFVSIWAKLAGHTEKHMPITLAGTALVGAMMAYGLLHAFRAAAAVTMVDAIVTSLVIWAIFIVPSHFYGVLWHKRHLTVFAIDVGYHLVYFILFSAMWAKFFA